jgi:hypothetical protein
MDAMIVPLLVLFLKLVEMYMSHFFWKRTWFVGERRSIEKSRGWKNRETGPSHQGEVCVCMRMYGDVRVCRYVGGEKKKRGDYWGSGSNKRC